MAWSAAADRIVISDVLGRTVFETSSARNSLDVDLSSHPKGMYFVKVQSGSDAMVEKIVLQ